MKHVILKSSVILGLMAILAACGNSDEKTLQSDTLQSTLPSTHTDTTHADTMISNGERVIGTDTSARQK